MLVLGVVLVVVALAVLVAALVGGSNEGARFDLGIFEVETNTLGVFLLGAATVFLLFLGLLLAQAGLRRSARRRKEQRELNRRSDKLAAREAERPPADDPERRPDPSSADRSGPRG